MYRSHQPAFLRLAELLTSTNAHLISWSAGQEPFQGASLSDQAAALARLATRILELQVQRYRGRLLACR
jgi:hypothetical protein